MLTPSLYYVVLIAARHMLRAHVLVTHVGEMISMEQEIIDFVLTVMLGTMSRALRVKKWPSSISTLKQASFNHHQTHVL